MPKPQPKKIDTKDLVALAQDVIREAKFPMMATVDGDQPRVRPVSPVHVDKFTIYIANLKSYAKTRQLAENPNVQLCYLDSHHNQVRIIGKAEIVQDRKLLQFFWDKNRLLEHYLGTIDNPELIVYRIVPGKVQYMQEWALTYHQVPLD